MESSSFTSFLFPQGFCPGSIIDQSPCTPLAAEDAQQCAAVAGGWSTWSPWSKCSQDCGQRGHRIRNRMCASPLPSNRSTPKYFCFMQICIFFFFLLSAAPTASASPSTRCPATRRAPRAKASRWMAAGASGPSGPSARTRASTASDPGPGKWCANGQCQWMPGSLSADSILP
jgi:hypothetical protein